jgi:hypothetical protein
MNDNKANTIGELIEKTIEDLKYQLLTRTCLTTNKYTKEYPKDINVVNAILQKFIIVEENDDELKN